MSTSYLAIVLGFVAVLSVISYPAIKRKLKHKARKCQGKIWLNSFPSATKQEIRQFLLIFVRAFAFPDHEKLQFRPDDKIFDVYRQLYPSKWLPDSLELETLARDIERTYGRKLENIWSEQLTLGELFFFVRTQTN